MSMGVVARFGHALLLSALTALTACGGGGGGADNAAGMPPEAAPCVTRACALTFSPATAVSQHDEGEQQAFKIGVRLNTAIDGPVYVLVVDPKSVFDSQIPLQFESQTSAIATLTVKSSALPGRYSDNLRVRLCRDAQCTREYPGSPVSLPYDVQIDSLVPRLTSLSTIGPDWDSHQGNAAHTGAVPISVSPVKFARRWQWRVGATPDVVDLSHVVTHRGKAYFSTSVGWSGYARDFGKHVFAIDEATGVQAWRFDYPLGTAPTAPAVSDGMVFAGANWSGSYHFWALDHASGAQLSENGLGTQWRYYKAATVMGGRLYQHGGYNNGGIASFDLANRESVWNNELWDVSHPGAVAVDETYAYAVTYGTLYTPESDGALVKLNRLTGAVVKKIRPSYPSSSTSQFFGGVGNESSPTPVITGPDQVVLSYLNPVIVNGASGMNHRLEKLDTATGNSVWRIDVPVTNPSLLSAYTSQNPQTSDPVSINGTLIVVNPANAKVEARRESDGQLLWSWAPPGEDQAALLAHDVRASPVSTATVVFIPTSRFVYGLDTATGKAVWRHGNTGQLAISGTGVLYVSGKDRLDAINLR